MPIFFFRSNYKIIFFFKKCLYIINLLERKGPLSLSDINDYYQYSSLYDGDEILPRTFLRYKDFIDETFPCYIEFNQRTGKYELHRHKALYGEDDSLYDYLLSAYHIEGMTELAGMTRDEIAGWMKEQGFPAFRGKQVFEWIHRGVDFDGMSNLPVSMREDLKKRAVAQGVHIRMSQTSKLDGTAKGGVVLSVHEELNVPVKWIGLGEREDDLERFNPEAFAKALFETEDHILDESTKV